MTEEVDSFYFIEYDPHDDGMFVSSGSRHYTLKGALDYVADVFNEDYPKAWKIIKRVMFDEVVKEKDLL